MKNFSDFILEKNSIDKKLIDQFGKIKIYSVNGKQIRDKTKSDEEFGLSSVHGCFPNLIPKNEIWIEDTVKENELRFLIYSSLYQIKLTENGVDPWDAYKLAIDYEKSFRKNRGKLTKKKLLDVKKVEYCTLGEITVNLVDGKKIRDHFKIDFMEGGHDHVYDWVPDNEIWIEKGIKESEIPLIILHEFVERTLMKVKRMNYDDAHDIAARVEYQHRPNKFTKKDIKDLTVGKALELSKSFSKK